MHDFVLCTTSLIIAANVVKGVKASVTVTCVATNKLVLLQCEGQVVFAIGGRVLFWFANAVHSVASEDSTQAKSGAAQRRIGTVTQYNHHLRQVKECRGGEYWDHR